MVKDLSNTKDYLIDIASESKYSGQDEEYREAFTKWRTKDNNRFGYKYVKDTREHTYAFGEGFENDLASDSERESLKFCSNLIGGTMLISAVIRLFQVMFDSRAGHLLAGSSIEVYGNTHPTDISATIVLSLFKPLSLLISIFFIAMFTKLPKKVFMPRGTKIPKRHTLCLFGVVGGCAAVCYVVSAILGMVFGTQLMSVPGGFVWCDSVGLNIHCFGVQYFITPVLHAILMNGLILQLLRQFGDSTAIMLTAAVESIMAINFINIGTHFVLSIIISILTIKTGSLLCAIAGRVEINLIFFALKLINTENADNAGGELYMLLVCIFIIGIALFCIGRLISFEDYKVNIKSADTELVFRDKLKTFVTAMPTITWLAASGVVWLYIMVS